MGGGFGAARLRAVARGRGIRGETKAVDIPITGLNFNNGNNAAQCLTLVQEGAGFWNRIGRKIAQKSLRVRGQIAAQGGIAALVEETIRYIIFYDKQTNGVIPTWNTLIQAYDNTGVGITNGTLDGLNLDKRDRFVVLRDRTITMPRTSAVGAPSSPPWGTTDAGSGMCGNGSAMIEEYIKLNNMEANFNATLNPATVAQVDMGGLFIIAQGTTGAQWFLNATYRLRFEDN